ncbi:putative aryl-alcohol dehydrogenase, partial [Hortaea werneckii]
DWTTSIEELMDSLDEVVKQGKVLYLGISDTPAYIVAACNTYAKATHKTQFSIYQGRWSILIRDMEREILPMCRHFGMAIAPWDAIGGGKFQSKAQMEERKKNNEGLRSMLGSGEQTEQEQKMSAALEEVGKEHGIGSVTAVALAYVLSQAPNVFPIVGGRKVEHLMDNIQALKLKLSDKQVEKLQAVAPQTPEFPMNFIGQDPHITGQPSFLVNSTARMAYVQAPKAIGHQ